MYWHSSELSLFQCNLETMKHLSDPWSPLISRPVVQLHWRHISCHLLWMRNIPALSNGHSMFHSALAVVEWPCYTSFTFGNNMSGNFMGCLIDIFINTCLTGFILLSFYAHYTINTKCFSDLVSPLLADVKLSSYSLCTLHFNHSWTSVINFYFPTK